MVGAGFTFGDKIAAKPNTQHDPGDVQERLFPVRQSPKAEEEAARSNPCED